MMQDTKSLPLVLTEESEDNLHSLVQTYQPLIHLEHIRLSIMRLCMSVCVWYIKRRERVETLTGHYSSQALTYDTVSFLKGHFKMELLLEYERQCERWNSVHIAVFLGGVLQLWNGSQIIVFWKSNACELKLETDCSNKQYMWNTVTAYSPDHPSLI